MKFPELKLPVFRLPVFKSPAFVPLETAVPENVPPAATLAAGILFLFPLIFLPGLANPFDLLKAAMLFLGGLLAAILLWLRISRQGKISLMRSPFDFAVILLPVLAAVSAWLSPNRVSSLVTDPLLFAGAALIFFLVGNLAAGEKNFVRLVKALLSAGILLSLLVIAAVLINILGEAAQSQEIIPAIFSLGFSPTGGPLSGVLLLAVLLPLAFGQYYAHKTKLNRLIVVILSLGLAAGIYSLIKIQPLLLPLEAGWKIATGTMGTSARTALLGFGPGNFVDAFTSFKPAAINNSAIWNLKFIAGANFYFYLLSTIGIAGLSVFVWLATRIIMLARSRWEMGNGAMEKGILASLLVALALFAFLPAPAVIIVDFFAILGLLAAKTGKTAELPVTSGLAKLAPAALFALALIFSAWHLGRFLLADYYFSQSQGFAAQNLGTQTYNAQIQAINLNPANDFYHLSYSQTNLALADSLAGQPNLTDQQKQAVVQLVQQAIREGRTAAALAPDRSANWENLAAIYRSLINFAQGADQWSLESLNQAIILDPTNPRIRLDLGGLYFAGRDYASAAQIFNQAVNLKPDLANSHYNLAQALSNLNMKGQALKELQTTANLVCPAGQAGATVSGTPATDCDRVNQ